MRPCLNLKVLEGDVLVRDKVPCPLFGGVAGGWGESKNAIRILKSIWAGLRSQFLLSVGDISMTCLTPGSPWS